MSKYLSSAQNNARRIRYYDGNDDSPHMYFQYTPMQRNRQDLKSSLSDIQINDYGNSKGKEIPGWKNTYEL